MSSGIITGNLASIGVASVVLSPEALSANTSEEQTFTVPGLRMRDVILGVSKPTCDDGVGIAGYRVSDANTLAITFVNTTAAPVTPTAGETYLITWARPDATLAGVSP